jgi:hypothetical protein
MKRIALVAIVVAVAACSKTDKSATTDTTAVGGAVAPSSDSTKKAMISGTSRANDSIHMMTSGSTTSGSMKDSSMATPKDTTKKMTPP